MGISKLENINPSPQVYYNYRVEGFIIFFVGAIILSSGIALRYYSEVGSITTISMLSSGAVACFIGICLQFVKESPKPKVLLIPPSPPNAPPCKAVVLQKKKVPKPNPKVPIKQKVIPTPVLKVIRHEKYSQLVKAVANFEYARVNEEETLTKIEELFITYGIEILPFDTSFDKTPFKNLSGDKAIKMVNLLLKCGIDPLRYRTNGSFLHIFARNDNYYEILKNFLDRLDCANFCDQSGMTPLAIACLTNGRTELDSSIGFLSSPLNAILLALHAKKKGYTTHIPDKKIEGFVTSGMTPFQRVCYTIWKGWKNVQLEPSLDEFERMLLPLLMEGVDDIEKELETTINDPNVRIFAAYLNALHMKNLALEEWKKVINETSVVIDATCGNGRDTKNLAALLNGKGKLIAYDVQEEAINNTKKLLNESSQAIVTYRLTSHEKFEENADLFVYNLGYLPGSDKKVKTKADITIKSLQSALENLNPGGLISIMCYRGHPEGVEEEEALNHFLKTLPSTKFSVRKHEWMNRQSAPLLILIWRHK